MNITKSIKLFTNNGMFPALYNNKQTEVSANDKLSNQFYNSVVEINTYVYGIIMNLRTVFATFCTGTGVCLVMVQLVTTMVPLTNWEKG